MGRSNSRRRREARRSLPPPDSTRYRYSRRSDYSDYSRYGSRKKFSDDRYIRTESRPPTAGWNRYVTKRKKRLVRNVSQVPNRSIYSKNFKLMSSTSQFSVGDLARSVRKPRRSVCENRAVRNQVVHALGLAGKKGSRAYTSKFTRSSKIRCK